MATETSDDKLHSRVTYDFSKVITGIDINPAYINGLQRITNDMIINGDRGKICIENTWH